MDRITREQAMTIVARAMKITGLEAGIADSTILAPGDNITRAEAAVIIRLLLKQSGLI